MDLDYQDDSHGLEIINEALNKFLPEIKFDSIDKKNRRLIFNTNDGKISLDYLSDGYQNMAAWLGDVLFHQKTVNRKLQKKGKIKIKNNFSTELSLFYKMVLKIFMSMINIPLRGK